MAEERIEVKAYAKINLCLDVQGLMDNGYHRVAMVMQQILPAASRYSSQIAQSISMKKQLDEMKHDYDAKEHGGAPILGISKPVIKAHGSSDAVAFKNAIRQAIDYAQSDVIYDIAVAAKEYNERKKLLKEQAAKAAAEAEAEAAKAAAADQDQTNVRG